MLCNVCDITVTCFADIIKIEAILYIFQKYL